MIDTTRLRIKFTDYRRSGTVDDAVEMASHIPALLDIIDTQAALIHQCAETIEQHLQKLQDLSRLAPNYTGHTHGLTHGDWCAECGCLTNHTTGWHREAVKDQPQEPTR